MQRRTRQGQTFWREHYVSWKQRLIEHLLLWTDLVSLLYLFLKKRDHRLVAQRGNAMTETR